MHPLGGENQADLARRFRRRKRQFSLQLAQVFNRNVGVAGQSRARAVDVLHYGLAQICQLKPLLASARG